MKKNKMLKGSAVLLSMALLSGGLFPTTSLASETLIHAEESSSDIFTIKDGEVIIQEYLISSGLNYKIGSPEYISFLTTFLMEEGNYLELENNPNYPFIRAYASTYLKELEESKVELVSRTGGFKIDESTKNKTIEEIRLENEIEEYSNNQLLINQTNNKQMRVTYNRTNAKNYMDRYGATGTYNTAYVAFKNDCTNFASQVVYAGGYPKESRTTSALIDQNTSYWYYKDSRHYTTSWISVSDFYNYWVGSQGHTVRKSDTTGAIVSYGKTGDVVQLYDAIGSRGWYHTIVLNSSGKYAGHTNDHTDTSLNNINSDNNNFRTIQF